MELRWTEIAWAMRGLAMTDKRNRGRGKQLLGLRLRLHRLKPSRPIRDARVALAFIKAGRIVLSTGQSSLPSLAEAIAGRQLRGSWMANPEVFGIYKILGTVSRSAAVLSAPLVLGKETFLDASLAPAVARIAGDATRRSACSASLPPLAKRLLTDVEARGEVRMDRWSASTQRGRKARLVLERLLLVTSRGLHTESGYHTAVVTPWRKSRIAMRFGKAAHRLGFEEAQGQLVLAAVGSAGICPEREGPRWVVFCGKPIEELVDEREHRRLRAGGGALLTLPQ